MLETSRYTKLNMAEYGTVLTDEYLENQIEKENTVLSKSSVLEATVKHKRFNVH